MINIGPWWLYDFLFLLIIVGLSVRGIFRGAIPMLYFLLSEVGIILIATFIPPLITNAVNADFYKMMHKMGVTDFMNNFSQGLNNLINDTLGSLNPGRVTGSTDSLDFDVTTLLDSVSKTMSAVILNVILLFSFFIVLNIVMVGAYFGFRNKLNNTRINKYVDLLLGGLLGAFLGIMITSVGVFITSMPIFSLNTQKFDINMKGKPEDIQADLEDRLNNGNEFQRKAISAQIGKVIPMMDLSYNTACLNKYMITPLISGIGQLTSPNTKDIMKIFQAFSDTVIEGYASDNIADTPIQACLQTQPDDVKTAIRILTETILSTEALIGHGDFAGDESNTNNYDDTGTDNSSGNGFETFGDGAVIFDNLKTFMSSENHGQRLDEEDFARFYNDYGYNEFIIISDNMERELGETAMVRVLRDPHLMYTFMKNVYDVNYQYAKIGTGEFLPNMFSSLYLAAGFELVPSGNMNILTGRDSNGHPHNFDLQNYMAYVRGQNNA